MAQLARSIPTRALLVLLTAAAAAGATAADEARAAAQRKLAFATSVAGTGNLGSWPEAGSASGLAAADAICRTLAADAGLPEPASFVAWISSTSTDAYCRLHGLAGKVADNCGQPILPAAAGPWVRTDGEPFAAAIDWAVGVHGQILSPLAVDENGAPVDGGFYTATDSFGGYAADGGTCEDWTGTAGGAWIGDTMRTSASWTQSATVSDCTAGMHLACLQPGIGPPLPHHFHGGAQAFVTSVAGMGDLAGWSGSGGTGGLAGADLVCQARAAAAGLPASGSFRAWLSDASTLVDAATRFTHTGPVIRLDGMLVAASMAELASGTLRVPIAVDENRTYVADKAAWTGTTAAGAAADSDCRGWIMGSGPDTGLTGSVNSTRSKWTNEAADTCSSIRRLYCLADVAVLVFVDDFESTETDGWSAATP